MSDTALGRRSRIRRMFEGDPGKELTEAYRALFGGDHGQGELILQDLARVCGLLGALEPGSSDASLRHFEGRRAVLCHILDRGRRANAKLGLKDVERVVDWRPGEEQGE